MRIAWLTLLCLALVAVPALAQVNEYYDNGPINGTVNAWNISAASGFIVSDSFLDTANSTITSFSFGVWETKGDVLNSVGWSITSQENGGLTYGSGTAARGPGGNLTDTPFATNQQGDWIDLITVTGLNVFQPAGGTYWLNLNDAKTAGGNSIYWDENSGVGCGGLNGTKAGCPSQASQSSLGTIPSEAFTINFTEPSGGTTPEPSSILLFGSGILGLAVVLRRKLGI